MSARHRDRSSTCAMKRRQSRRRGISAERRGAPRTVRGPGTARLRARDPGTVRDGVRNSRAGNCTAPWTPHGLLCTAIRVVKLTFTEGKKYREMSLYTKVSRTRHENTNRKRKRPVKRTDAQIRTFRSLGEVVQRGRAGGRTGHGGLEPATARKWGNKNSMRKWTTGWRRHFTSKKALMSFVVKEL